MICFIKSFEIIQPIGIVNELADIGHGDIIVLQFEQSLLRLFQLQAGVLILVGVYLFGCILYGV